MLQMMMKFREKYVFTKNKSLVFQRSYHHDDRCAKKIPSLRILTAQ